MRQQTRTLFLLLFTVGCSAAGVPTCDTNRHPEQPITRLKKELFCNYDALVRPVKDFKVTTSVSVLLWLKSIDITEDNIGNNAEIHAWTAWSWKDEFLTWDASKHQGIDSVLVNGENMWLPDIVIQDSSEFQHATTYLRSSRCIVRPGGSISCVSLSTYRAFCVSDVSLWPFDTHTCELMLVAVNDSMDRIDLLFRGVGYSSLEYVPNREWQLLGVEAKRKTVLINTNDTFINLLYKFTMKRHSSFYASTVLSSAFALNLLTIASFWIEPECSARLSLCCLNIFIQCIYLQSLQFLVGSSGDSCPRIILFFRDSTMLAVVALVTSIFALRLSSCSSSPPDWFRCAFQWIIDNRVGQVLLAGAYTNEAESTQRKAHDEEEAGDIVATEELSEIKSRPGHKWSSVVGVLDRIAFYVFIIVIFIILIIRVS